MNISVSPIWKDAVTIAACSSNLFVPYLSVYLQSIKKNTNFKKKYDIVILENDITIENKKILQSFFEEENFSLRFFNPSAVFDDIREKINKRYFIPSLYRLMIPIIFQKYSKIIFTDIDLIFEKDPEILFNLKLNGKSVLSALEPIWSSFINTNFVIEGINIKDYSKSILKLSNIEYYFNTGVMLCDIQQLIKLNVTDIFKEKLVCDQRYLFQDQCILNEVLYNNIGVLPFEWNKEVLAEPTLKTLSPFFVNYCKVTKPGIIHFLGSSKPWNRGGNYVSDDSYKWWKYARNTPYYEILITDIVNKKIVEFQNKLINAENVFLNQIK